MSMGMSLGLRQVETLSMEQRLVLSHREELLLIQGHVLSLRLELLSQFRGVSYHPTGKCPKCNKVLRAVEVIRGFSRDPLDYTTKCPKCKTRFEPKLTTPLGALGYIEVAFFCSSQTLFRLRESGMNSFSPEELKRGNQALYHSAIVHFGTLRAAFKKIGVKYKFEEKVEWEKKIRSFLGRLPDTVIARAAGITAKRVAKQRKLHKVPRCTKQTMLEEAIEQRD